MLEVKNLSVSYGKNPTVKNISFMVKAGQTAGLVGESGSGKSTVVRSILGLLPGNGRITSGSITLEGKSLTGLNRKEWKRIRGSKISMTRYCPVNARMSAT